MKDHEIRKLTIDDLPEIVSRIRDAGNESGWASTLEFNPEHVAVQAASMIGSENFLVIGSNDVGAVLIASLACNWYSPTLQASELIVYVHPDVRCSGRARELVSKYIEWAKEKGAKKINIGVSLDICQEKVGSLYRSIGFNDSGILFTYGAEK